MSAPEIRLPDLPDAGYATLREKQLTDLVCQFMRETERNRELLLTIVLTGRQAFRKKGGAVLRALHADDDLLDCIYDYFTLQACEPEAQRQLLRAAQNRDQWRAIVRQEMPKIEAQREGLRLLNKWQP